MKARKRHVTMLIWLISALALSACGTSSETAEEPDSTSSATEAESEARSEETHEFVFASYVSPGLSSSVGFSQWAEEIDERTDGRFKVKDFLWSEALLKAAEITPGVADGRADIGFMSPLYHPAELPLSNVVTIPFVTDNAAAQAWTLYDMYREYDAYREEWHKQGVHLLRIAPVGQNIIGSKFPVDGVEDLSGKRIRGIGYVEQALKAVGANPVSIAQPEVYEALERGVLDATSGVTLDIATDFKYHEVTTHFIDTGFGQYGVTADVMNLEKWEALPEDIRQIIEDYSREAMENALQLLEDAEAKACDTILEKGVTVQLLPEEQVEDWKNQISEQAHSDWLAKAGEPGEAFYEEYIQRLNEHEESSDYTPGIQACAERA